jgi:tRNA pseudouridine55 synthase
VSDSSADEPAPPYLPHKVPFLAKLPAQPQLHGVLVIDKPLGWTSRDVVNRVGRLLGDKTLGHAGTLDPHASGVLVLVFGDASRLVRWLQDHPKTYRTTVALGAATSSDDATGEVIATAPVPLLAQASVQEWLQTQVGVLDQIPPQVSALQQDGIRDHERVRRGEVVVRPPRQVHLYGSQILALHQDTDHQAQQAAIELELTVGSGFYVRSLARDLGVALGTLGHVQSLRRLAGSGWTLAESIELAGFEALPLEERRARIVPVLQAAQRVVPVLPVNAEQTILLQQGKRPLLAELPVPQEAAADQTWLAVADNKPIALVVVQDDSWKVIRGFPVPPAPAQQNAAGQDPMETSEDATFN